MGFWYCSGGAVNLVSPLINYGLGSIQGSIAPSRGTHIKMLRFSAFHDIKPIVQTFPLTAEGLEDAMDKLRRGQVRYRAVLVAEGA